jgi:hypothetical protein
MMHESARPSVADANRSVAAYCVMICSVVIGFQWVFPRVQLLIAPVSDSSLLDSWAIPISYFSAVLFGGYVATLLGVLYGLRMASRALICVLALMVVMAIIDNVAVIQYMLELSGKDALLRSTRNVWELTGSARWLSWLVFNYWFFIWRGRGADRQN